MNMRNCMRKRQFYIVAQPPGAASVDSKLKLIVGFRLPQL